MKQSEDAMSFQFIEVKQSGRITVVTLNRPSVLNALHKPAHFELHDAFNWFCADPDQWVAIITGAGNQAFCAGNDLKWQAEGGERGWNLSGFGGLALRFHCDKPIIAAVNGMALGGGFEIALACDLVIAAENATFGLPQPRIGLAALAGGLQRLPRQIGLKRAMDMILTGRRVSAQDGFEFGFVNEVVPQGEALSAAERWADQICQNSPMSIRASKQTVLEGLNVSLPQAMLAQRDYPGVRDLIASEDFVEGLRAFAEKRPPRWQGK
jgi:crotonobetainyl-CoA hydratase